MRLWSKYFNIIFSSNFFSYLILLPIILLLKINIITGQVFTDELFYSAISKLIHKNIVINHSLPDSLIFFYPFVTSWIYYFDVNHIFYLRFIDQSISIIFYLLIFRCFNTIVKNNFYSFVLTIYLLFKTNSYVNSGYNNSIIVSYIFLAYAFIIYKQNLKKINFFKIGSLITFSVFFREANIFFVVIIFLSIFFFKRKSLLKFILGGICTVFFFILFLIIFRENHINSIYHLPGHYKSFHYEHLFYTYEHIWVNFKDQSYLFLKNNLELFLILCTLSIINFIHIIKKKNIYSFLFFTFISIAPLIETFFKFANNYHFANMYLGIFGLISINLCLLNKRFNFSNFFAKNLVFLFCLPIIFFIILYMNFYSKNFYNLKLLFSNNNWPENIINNSNYLIIKKDIEKEYKKNYTFLSADPEIPLNSLVNIEAPSYQTYFVSYFYQNNKITNYREDQLNYINFFIKNCQPNMIFLPQYILSKNFEYLDTKEIINNLTDNGYSFVKLITANPNLAYNHLSGSLFIKNNVNKCKL